MKVAICVAAPLMLFRVESNDQSLVTVIAVQIYEALQLKEKVLACHYNTTQEDAALQEQHWTATVWINEDLKEYKSFFFNKDEGKVCVKVGRATREDCSRKAPECATNDGYFIYTHSTVPRRSQIEGAGAQRNRQCATSRSGCARRIRMHITSGICYEEGWKYPIMCELSTSQHHNCTRWLPHCTYRWVHRLIGWSTNVLNVGRKLQTRGDWDRWNGSWQESVCSPPWTMQVNMDAIRVEVSLATFEPAMDVILASVEWQHAIVYIDNIIIFLKSPGKHL